MKIQTIIIKLLYLFTTLLVLNSCVVETAKKSKKQFVIIYSDCLKKEDTKIFKQFEKRENIKVKIYYFPTDSIINRIKRESYTTNADVLILKSLFGAYKAAHADIFEECKSWKINELVKKSFRSTNYTWYGIGIEPYVIVTKNDTITGYNSIGDLLAIKDHLYWSTNLQNTTDILPLVAPILQKKKRTEARDWYNDFKQNQIPSQNDKNGVPLMNSDVLLTNYGNYLKMSERNDSSDLKLDMIFVNQTKRGAYFNLHCIGIVKQARNFNNAKLFTEYVCTASANEVINNTWKTFPISLNTRVHPYAYQNTSFKLFGGSAAKSMLNYRHISKIIKKGIIVDTLQ